MSSSASPLVSIVTPVYNNREYLSECIESVQAQTYKNWEYTIVDNCSTDGSVEVARRYAAKDLRIRICENSQFLKAIPNHNRALLEISPESKYCKVVFADDWIFPRCLEEMVAVAEEHPSVGVVGAYGLEETRSGSERRDVVMWTGLPYLGQRIPGREVCRRLFLDGTYVFGTATSVLYRSSLVWNRIPFYNEANFHADSEVCVALLREHDFGFVHQVLTFKRWHPGSLGSISLNLNTYFASQLYELRAYGADYLSPEEQAHCMKRKLAEYYNFLAVNALRGRRDAAFWQYHRRKLDETVGFSRTCLLGAIAGRGVRAFLNPQETLEKMMLTPRAAE